MFVAAITMTAAMAVHSQNDAYVAAMIAGDAKTIASHFEPTAIIVGKGNVVVRGRDDIQAYLETTLAKSHPTTGSCETSHLDVEGTAAFETGHCTFDFPTQNGVFHYAYHYLALWHQQSDGTWLLATDVSE